MEYQKYDDIRLEHARSPADWKDACTAFSHATAFHRYDFLKAVAPCLQCTFEPLVVLCGNQKVGVAPLLVKKYGPFCVLNRVPFPYLGPLVPAPLIPATLAALAAEAGRRRALDHYQFFSPSDSPPAVEGFTRRTDRTFVMPLRDRSDQELMKAMDSTRRKEIRRSERMGLQVYPASLDDFKLMDIWNEQLYASQGLRPIYPPGTYERIFSALNGAPGSSFYSARIDGRTVGVQINLSSARRVFAWQAGIDGSFRSPSPQSILMWHTARQARDAGADEFDLVGAPSEGIATYKIRLGAEQRSYVLMRRAVPAYRLARAVTSRMLVAARKSLRLAQVSAKS
ncbi:MAG TPA: GNAT family N-acetyltransferase [Trebonia sp.]|jgi:CelD/BcsL family acetyltransferase involved in cellulose biosynthesis|nr:GNAT family N-acetyltransferase [Trebonia sp.]